MADVSTSYRVPAVLFESELTVRKSRFIARVVPVSNREQVNTAVRQARADHPDARHHCWAYLLGRPADAVSAGMSDDGEPAGTAGKPILNVLQHGEFGDVLVVVIRYFGGVKLGAGGLARAYGGAARQALEHAPAVEYRPLNTFYISADFSSEQPIRHALAVLAGELLAVDYDSAVTLTVAIPTAAVESFASFCKASGYNLRRATP